MPGRARTRRRLRCLCWTFGCGSAAFGQVMAAASPRLLNERTEIPYQWDTGGDGHRRIMAKHQPILFPQSLELCPPLPSLMPPLPRLSHTTCCLGKSVEFLRCLDTGTRGSNTFLRP